MIINNNLLISSILLNITLLFSNKYILYSRKSSNNLLNYNFLFGYIFIILPSVITIISCLKIIFLEIQNIFTQ